MAGVSRESPISLYFLTLQKSTAITKAVYGSFSGPTAHEFAVARGKTLELLRHDPETHQLVSVARVECFGNVRSLLPFRLIGNKVDHIVVGSDSGKIVILRFDVKTSTFEKVHEETYGKTGCRRVTPGQFLAADAKGRALMIASLEKQKLVYVINRDASTNLTISSPLEAHKARMLCFDMCGTDTNFENPVFACLELDYSDADEDETGSAAMQAEKYLTYYELDLGLNHVVRKWSDVTDRGANMVLPVPGGDKGPGGVLVLAENWVIYRHKDHPELRTPLPRRADLPASRGTLLVAHATHVQRDLFFVLAQSEYGDLYKISMDFENQSVSELTVQYFDTVSVAASLCITKKGFLFVAAEFGAHYYYQFTSIDVDADDAQATSVAAGAAAPATPVTFSPRKPRHLRLISTLDSMAPLIEMQCQDLVSAGEPQFYALCGRGARSSLRVMRHGLAVTEFASSELPGIPSAVWTLRSEVGAEHDALIVLSFSNGTIVLKISDTVEEVKDTGFADSSPTFSTGLMQDGAMVQVYKEGLRHIRPGGKRSEFKVSVASGEAVVHATLNKRQVAYAKSDGEITYFELESDGANPFRKVTDYQVGCGVVALEIGELPRGRLRFPFLAVAGDDKTVRLLSLEEGKLMEPLALQSLPAQPTSLCITVGEGGSSYLNIGLNTGVVLRTKVDTMTGKMGATRQRFLGFLPVKLRRVVVQGKRAMLALSSRSWLCYTGEAGRYEMTPLSYDAKLESVHPFSSEQCPDGLVAVSGKTLRILAVDALNEQFNTQTIPLDHTPRRSVVHRSSGLLITIECDHNAIPLAERAAPEGAAAVAAAAKVAREEAGGEDDDDEEEEDEEAQASMVGLLESTTPGEVGRWASCVRAFDPSACELMSAVALDGNEAALSVAVVEFLGRGGEEFILVGTSKDAKLHPRSNACGYIHVYRLVAGKLSLVHKTEVNDAVHAIAPFHGRVLVAVGSKLRIYDLGKQRLLRKCENKRFPALITSLHVAGDRIYVGDVANGAILVRYRSEENQLTAFADETAPRMLTAMLPLDFNTAAVADKFGNFSITRLGEDADPDASGPSAGLWDAGSSDCPNKLSTKANFHVGEVITSMCKTKLMSAGVEVVLCSTIMGGMCLFMPFTSREDVDFLSQLEMHMRAKNLSCIGRDHISYRSYYSPVKDVIDGDLCEMFTTLPDLQQREIAEDMDRSPAEIAKKLEDLRHMCL
tara:strand:- start:2062 stop:5706 length:3645 start_codon:yes stop_codon:yes gene_type:complete